MPWMLVVFSETSQKGPERERERRGKEGKTRGERERNRGKKRRADTLESEVSYGRVTSLIKTNLGN